LKDISAESTRLRSDWAKGYVEMYMTVCTLARIPLLSINVID